MAFEKSVSERCGSAFLDVRECVANLQQDLYALSECEILGLTVRLLGDKEFIAKDLSECDILLGVAVSFLTNLDLDLGLKGHFFLHTRSSPEKFQIPRSHSTSVYSLDASYGALMCNFHIYWHRR